MGRQDRDGQGFAAVIQPPFSFCRLALRVSDEGLQALLWLPPAIPLQAPRAGSLAAAACAQLQAYFRDPRHAFDLPLDRRGTPFQERVWEALAAIPAGEIRTYGSLARLLGSAPRAVGGACRANPLPIVVPCHRVVGVAGPGGYAGESGGGLAAVKRWLLRHEGHETR